MSKVLTPNSLAQAPVLALVVATALALVLAKALGVFGLSLRFRGSHVPKGFWNRPRPLKRAQQFPKRAGSSNGLDMSLGAKMADGRAKRWIGFQLAND